jgi:hypothetical protein
MRQKTIFFKYHFDEFQTSNSQTALKPLVLYIRTTGSNTFILVSYMYISLRHVLAVHRHIHVHIILPTLSRSVKAIMIFLLYCDEYDHMTIARQRFGKHVPKFTKLSVGGPPF